jgi:16S rRNA (guanine527-N7)-methyltransferase
MSFSIQPWRIKDWFSFLSDYQLKQMQVFATELVKANQSLNLIPSKSISILDLVHFGDSILASQLVYLKCAGLKSIHDIGSGNGFPGIVFGILYPEVSVTLVESDSRKAEFLKTAVKVLDQKNISVQNKAVESMVEGSIEVGISRGFAQLSKALITTRKSFAKNANYFHMKGDEWSMEVSQIPTQLCSQWDVALLGEYKLPTTDFKVAVVKTARIN